MTTCKHPKILSYIGYVNVYFCPSCGLRFNVMPKYDQKIEGEKCVYEVAEN